MPSIENMLAERIADTRNALIPLEHFCTVEANMLRNQLVLLQSELRRWEGESADTGLRLGARIDNEGPSHVHLTVFQNGGNAGHLCVETKHKAQILSILTLSGKDTHHA